MRCDLAGLLINALECKSDNPEMYDYYRFCIRELINNLRELKQRHVAGDTEVLNEFFAIYVIDAKVADAKT